MDQQFARLSQIASTKDRRGRYPISPATWWRWVSTHYAPAPTKLGPNTTVWSLASLDAFDQKVAAAGQLDEAKAITTPSLDKPEGEPRKSMSRRKRKRAELATV